MPVGAFASLWEPSLTGNGATCIISRSKARMFAEVNISPARQLAAVPTGLITPAIKVRDQRDVIAQSPGQVVGIDLA